jgi:hypothetical protein
MLDHAWIRDPLFNCRQQLFLKSILPDSDQDVANAAVAVAGAIVPNISPLALAADDYQPRFAATAYQQSTE